MDSHKLSVKLFAEDGAGVPVEALVPVFHSWIRDQSLADHLLIDVADYAHVPNGPGTLIVSHEANIHFDRENGAGVLYIRKQPIEGASSFRERLSAVFSAALRAAAKLEAEPSLDGLNFRTDEVAFRINDRLLAPNDAKTFAAIKSDLQKFADELFRGGVTLEHKPDALRLFEVRIKSSKAGGSVSDLLARLEPAPAR